MIVHYLDTVGIAILPLKTNAPLIVDANAVLTLSITRQLFEAIGQRYAQILQNLGSIQDLKFPSRDSLDALRESARELAIEYPFRLFAGEGLDHHS